jgi:hypothetical protein
MLVPHMKQRIVHTSSTEDFKRLIMRKYHDIRHDFKCKELSNSLDKMSIGCFIVVYENPETGSREPIVMHRFVTSLSSMIAKENLFSLHIRYLTEAERSQCATITDQ